MKGKYLILALVTLILLVSVTSVCAQNNDSEVMVQPVDENELAVTDDEDVLEKTYFYDADGDEYVDDTVVTHNVVKYYGDTDTKFKVKVYDEDYYPEEGVYVSFGRVVSNYKEKTTNINGIVYFPINYKVGTHDVETYIESEDGQSYWSAYNTVKIKSTIVPKELVKYSTSKKKFKIKFLDVKGKALSGKTVKIKKNGRWYKFKTDKDGFVKLKSKFKVGKTAITAYNPASKEKRKISVVVLKKGTHKINIRIDDPTVKFPIKKLKNGDRISTVYETEYRQYNPGVYVESYYKDLDNAKHTKLVKAKFFFKNKKTGKIITKTSKKVRYGTIVIKPISGYSPFKATVWYRDKI